MTIAVRLEVQAQSRPTQGLIGTPSLQSTLLRKPESSSRLSAAKLAFRIFAAFRAHPHINNVLTHISGANWTQVERTLEAIFDPATTSDGLSPLAQNIVDLMCAERGITGRILKPYFHDALYRLLEPSCAERLIRHVEALSFELGCKAAHPASASGKSSCETGHD